MTHNLFGYVTHCPHDATDLQFQRQRNWYRRCTENKGLRTDFLPGSRECFQGPRRLLLSVRNGRALRIFGVRAALPVRPRRASRVCEVIGRPLPLSLDVSRPVEKCSLLVCELFCWLLS